MLAIPAAGTSLTSKFAQYIAAKQIDSKILSASQSVPRWSDRRDLEQEGQMETAYSQLKRDESLRAVTLFLKKRPNRLPTIRRLF